MEQSNSKLTTKSLQAQASKLLDFEAAQKTDNLSQLQDILRDSFIQYKETAARCQIQFRHKAIGEQFNRLYYTPNVPFLEEPEKQKNFRNDFINDVGQAPEPKPLFCIADQLHADALEALGDCSDPKVTKEQLANFFTRRSAQLQHKKHKLIKRWANAYLTAEDLDRVHAEFDKELSYLQIEQDSVASRLMRIVPDDRYSNDPESVERPKPTGTSSSIQSRTQNKDDQQALLYAEIEGKQANASALRQDDFEVFLRQKTYLNRVLRPSKKLIQSIKWLSYDQRYEIWGDSRIMMYEFQQKFAQEKFKTLFIVAEEVKRKLAEIGIIDEKGVSVCTERYIFHLKGKGFTTRTQQMLNSHKFDHQEPHMLVASLAELKAPLIQLANEYGLNCSQIDLDKGQQFAYQLQTFFPGKFESQINAMTFDWEDSGHQTEVQIIDRLTKNLGLSKDLMIEELSRHCAEQRQTSILNALNVGKTGQQEASLKDLTENELDKDQFIRHNLIRKLKTIEFFSLDETDVRLRRADWLEYVCWQPTVNLHVQRQNQLLSGTSNPVDHLLRTAVEFTDIQDSVTVNKVLEESASYHIQRIQEVMTNIAQCQGAPNNMKGSLRDSEAVIRSLHYATNPALARGGSKIDPNLNDAQQQQFQKFADVPNVDPLAQNLTKAFYTLRLIKTRDLKIQMLSVLNYFRAIQRILALDVREFMTREKGLGDYSNILDPHFGKNSEGKSIAKQQPPSGPSEIFNANLIREMDVAQNMGETRLDPVSFKAYKLRNKFETQAISTCPLVPKHHRTFGQKIGPESVSAETDRQHFSNTNQKRAHSLLTLRDRVNVDLETREVYVTNEYGCRIVYFEALNDLVEIEDELVKIGSYYINQHELLIQNNEILEQETSARPTSLIDRAQIALELIEKEYNFQFAKIELVEQFMEAYEHIYDPLESMRVLQMIVDLIAERPRLNTEATMYSESYDSEILLMKTKASLYTEFAVMQKDVEREQNKQVHDYLEIKHRKIQESIDKYWIEVAAKQKKQHLGSDEPDQEDSEDKDMSELLRQKMEENQQQATSRQEALDRIKRRHITEFANEQFSNFAEVLGLPQVTAEELYRRFDQKEPIIIDSLRENAFFQKMVEGYPIQFRREDRGPQKLGLHTPGAGLTDFFDSMAQLSKFNAALCQSFAELEKECLPENGFAVSCLELCMFRKAMIEIKKRRTIIADAFDVDDLKGQNFFEEDFYLGCPDKLIQVMKELHIEFHPENLYKRASPLVAGKLDLYSVRSFNFPRIKSKDVVEALTREGVQETKIAEFFIQKTLEIARQIVARPNVTSFTEHENKNTEFEKAVKVPSLMIMCCNLYEVIRLREEIIMRMNECKILGKIYSNQCSQASKPTKFSFGDQIQFNVNQLMKECTNLVDLNDGSSIHFDPELPFMEFDRTLAANLDFKSNNCIKALLMDLGVAELRTILHLQVAQHQLLIVAVRMNQLLSDKAQKGLQELELIEKKEITVPNSIIDLTSILANSMDSQNITAIKNERMRMRQVLTKSVSDCFYMILPRKSRERINIAKKFTQLLQRLNSTEQLAKPEVSLRILRSFRLQLCQSYCQGMIQEAQRDSVKIQILDTCNVLRLRASLLPTSCQIFRLGKSETQENLSFDSYRQLANIEEYSSTETKQMNVHSILGGHGICSQAQTIYYIPSAEEICLCDRTSLEAMSKQTKDFSVENFNLDGADELLKAPYNKVKALDTPHYRIDDLKQQYGVRKVWFEESLPLANMETYSLLVYLTQMLSIFDLEFSMLRNFTKSSQVMELESKTQTGRPFWSQVKELQKQLERRQHQEHSADDSLVQNKFSYKVIQKLNDRKKAWVDLIEDLQAFANKMQRLESMVQKLSSERRNIHYICDLMTLQHQSTFYTFLNGVENMLEYYLDKENDEYFQKMLEIRDLVTSKNTQSVLLIRSNGFFVSNAQLAATQINVDESDTQSFISYKQQQQTVVDERALIPRQISILPRLYGRSSLLKTTQTNPGYNNLIQSAFYNFDDENRRLIAVNFTQLDEIINEYLIFKGLLENPNDNKPVLKGKDYAQEVFLAQTEVLALKIEAGHLERVLISWDSDDVKLPTTTKDFKLKQRKFRDQNTLKILSERDQLNEIYWSRLKIKNPVAQSKTDKQKELLAGLSTAQQKNQSYFSKINQLKAEIKVSKTALELAMVKISINMIRNEHSGILACFEVSAQDRDISLFVHPCQQFASTMYLNVDRVPHLDVVAKVGCLQQFLTRLRNRCTEVETLTSGPGIVFSMKDFNDCLSIFAKQLIKYSEEELRGRCETSSLREHQYHHLIYIKQMETLYYKQKCEQFLKNIDQIVNSKMFSKGNQMIYELDLTARELQTLKDHYYIMERNLREEIRLNFLSDLNSKGTLIRKQKDDFLDFRKQINNELSEEIATQINDLDLLVKMKNHGHHQSHLKHADYEKGGKRSDPELLSEIKYLTDTLRKQKILHMMKTVVARERHERELAELKLKLTQNQGLWDSLAESEKREQITAQELALTKQNLTHYERLIEKLYTQLEHINNQKTRLEQFKKSKSKRIDELEGKMKDLEILDNIDLSKILEEIRTRDNKIHRLDKVDQTFNERILQLQNQHSQQIEEMKKLLAAEKSAKGQAFEKLDAMRVEMKSLEGKDSVKNDLWKEKCKELYDICRDLEQENSTLKSAVKDLQDLNQKQKQETQLQTMGQSEMSELSYGQPNTREALILSRRQFIQKPFTADYGKQKRGFSGHVGNSNRRVAQNLIQSMNNIQTLNLPNPNGERFPQSMKSTTLQTNEMRLALQKGPFVISGSLSTNTGAEALSNGKSQAIGFKQSGKLLGQMSVPHVHGALKYPASESSSLENVSQKQNDSSTRKVNTQGQMSAQGFSIKNKA